MAPLEIGAAAAYEAWRNWKAHYGVYAQPISSDRDRQREALIGMAVAEGMRQNVHQLFAIDSYLGFCLIC